MHGTGVTNNCGRPAPQVPKNPYSADKDSVSPGTQGGATPDPLSNDDNPVRNPGDVIAPGDGSSGVHIATEPVKLPYDEKPIDPDEQGFVPPPTYQPPPEYPVIDDDLLLLILGGSGILIVLIIILILYSKK